MHFLQAINSDISVLIVCNKTGGTIKGDIKKSLSGLRGLERNDKIIEGLTQTIDTEIRI